MSKYIGDVSAYAYAVSKGYTGTEEEFAELMADYADVGQRAEDAAESALNSKTAAQTAAQTATTKASEASTSATSASSSASAASASASAASGSATNAAASATAASGSATSAAGSATTASTKASEASASATAANTAKTAAQTAQAAAEAAKTAAETAAATFETDTTLTVSGKAADAKATGDAVNDLKSNLENNFQINGNVKPNLVVGSFVDAANNSIGASSNFSMTDPIPVKKGQVITLTARGYNAVVGMIATCNADNTFRTTVVKSIDSNEHDYIYNVTEDGYIVCSFNNNHDHKIAISIDYYSELENVKSSNDTIENTLDFIYEGTENVEIVIYANAFIDATNNRYNSGGNFNITDSVHLFKGQTINLTATGYSTVVGMINIYNSENDTYQTVVRSDGNTEHTYSYTATSECDVRMCYLISAGASANIVTNDTDSVRLNNIESDIGELKNTDLENVEYPKMFTNIICIGDSLTRGESGGSQSVQLSTNYPFYFEKLTGATCYNGGLSGRTTKQWWDEFGSTITGFANYDCAIIYLGTNGGLTDTIETDCNASDYTQNADTNTGCYGKIIGKIKADSPNCKIFCVAGPSEYLNRDSTMNPVVRKLADFYEVGLIDLSGCLMDDDGTTTSVERYLYRPIDGIHYNKLGYFTFANMIYDFMKSYISKHLFRF